MHVRVLLFIGKYFIHFQNQQRLLEHRLNLLQLGVVEGKHEVRDGRWQQTRFAMRQRLAKLVQVGIVVQNRLKTPQTVLGEYKKNIAVGEVEMRAAMALPDVPPGRLAQNP